MGDVVKVLSPLWGRELERGVVQFPQDIMHEFPYDIALSLTIECLNTLIDFK